MKRNLAVLRFFFVFSAAVLIVATVYVGVNVGKAVSNGGGLFVVAHELDKEPVVYFSLMNPDLFVLEAIKRPDMMMQVGDWDATSIDDLIRENGTNNVEIAGSYYNFGMGSAEPTAVLPEIFVQVVVAGWLAWVVVFVVVVFVRKIRSKKE